VTETVNIHDAKTQLSRPRTTSWPSSRSRNSDCIPVLGGDAVRAADLPMHHRHPFDRTILAQALRLDAVIVSRDPALEAYDVAILRA
jgi:PIN domain nuclease of toxin-antitoxin system